MQVHIVYCHPSEDSLTAEVRDAFIRGLVDSGKSYTLSDLYKQGFQTDMTEQEYLRDAYYNNEPSLSEDVLVEQGRINDADALVFIYPVFWTEAPAKLVGWFDRVWSFGFAYGADGDLASVSATDEGELSTAHKATVGGDLADAQATVESESSTARSITAERALCTTSKIAPMRTLEKVLVIACAGNTKERLIKQGRLQSMENVMLDDRIHDRARHKEFVLLGGTDRSEPLRRQSVREMHLATAYKLGLKLSQTGCAHPAS